MKARARVSRAIYAAAREHTLFIRLRKTIESIKRYEKNKTLQLSKGTSGRKKKVRRTYFREFGLLVMGQLTDDEFKRMFRMSRFSFDILCNAIAIDLSVDILQACRSSGSEISVKTRLACTLRYLAGGSHLDIAALFGVSARNFFNVKSGVLWPTVDALMKCLNLEFDGSEVNLKRTAHLS